MNHKIHYKGRDLLFDRRYLSNVRNAFKENALGEQTAFQLADDSNRHDTEEDKLEDRNWDPERYRGEIVDMKVVNSGLYGKYKLTPEGIKLVQNNPRLGVSASLKENYERDGRKYPVVMRHCLGTLNPRIKGMSPWSNEEVTLSDTDDDNEEVLDLTMPENDETEKVEVSKAEWDAIKAFMEEQKSFNAQLEEALGDDDESETETGTEREPANLSDDDDEDDPRLVELSERLEAAEKRNKQADNRAAAAEFKSFARELKTRGVPKAMIDLAEPILSTAGDMTINLSDDTAVDPREAMKKMLIEACGYIDMSDEDGHARADAGNDAEDKALDEIVEHDFMLDEF